GFSVSQWPGKYHAETREMEMTTFLLHTSGQWMRETLTIPLPKVDAQGYGSAVTYARRYALQSALGLSPEDDDGNAASRPANDSNGNGNHATISDAERDTLQAQIEASPKSVKEICDAYKIPSLKELPAAAMPKLQERLAELTKEAA
ncbi:MAG TPA: ERF family protein, partial [Woeseiaceae bacterium]